MLRLEREPSADGATVGRLSVNGRFLCFTLEDTVRDGPKIAHETAIPAGRYPVRISRSTRFKTLLPEVLKVPDFTGIRIHAGNTSEDTSGCILVGLARKAHAPEVLSSRAALGEVQAVIAKALASADEVWLEVVNAPAEPKRLA